MLLFSPLLAQVNVGSPQAVFLGLAIASSGAGLYFLRSFRPELARDHDIFFAAIGLLCGGIVFFNGWRLDPILMFSQILLGGSAIFFAVESIRMRGITTNQARRNTPIVDDDRPVGRVYRAELDELSPSRERPRRIRSARDSDDDVEEAYTRESMSSEPRRSRPRRSRPSGDSRQGFDRGDVDVRRPNSDSRQGFERGDTEAQRPRRRPRTEQSDRRPPSSSDEDDIASSRRRRASGLDASAEEPRRSRSSSRSGRRPRNAPPRQRDDDSYVDYRPMDYRNSNRGYDASADDEWA
ncbi:MAG: Ycf66 family protein [Thermosynechococcaceae cyanobacterium]